MSGTSRPSADAGWSSLVLLGAVVPLLIGIFALCTACGGVVYAWMRADAAAEAGALAAAAGGDAEAAAVASLSERLVAGARVDVDAGVVTVLVVPLPDAVPGTWPPVRARATSAPEAGS